MFADGESPSYSINRWLPNANDLKGKTDLRIDSFREEFHSCLYTIESDGRAISSHPDEDSTHSIRRVEFIHAIASSSQRNHTIHHRFVESLAVPLDNLPAIHSFSFSTHSFDCIDDRFIVSHLFISTASHDGFELYGFRCVTKWIITIPSAYTSIFGVHSSSNKTSFG